MLLPALMLNKDGSLYKKIDCHWTFIHFSSKGPLPCFVFLINPRANKTGVPNQEAHRDSQKSNNLKRIKQYNIIFASLIRNDSRIKVKCSRLISHQMCEFSGRIPCVTKDRPPSQDRSQVQFYKVSVSFFVQASQNMEVWRVLVSAKLESFQK